MLTQYSSKLLIALLTLQHALRIRLRHGTKGYHANLGGSSLAKKVENLSSIISDARVLYRIWGILPIIKTVSSALCPRNHDLWSWLYPCIISDDLSGEITTSYKATPQYWANTRLVNVTVLPDGSSCISGRPQRHQPFFFYSESTIPIRIKSMGTLCWTSATSSSRR